MKSIDEWRNTISDQSGKTIIVTGANTGLGFQDSRFLADKGARIIMACRDLEKASQAMNKILEEHPRASLDVIKLDLADFAAIDTFAAEIANKYPRLDVLINNAAAIAPPYQKTAQGFELGIGVNHLGHFRLTAQLLPLLLKTNTSRIVTVSSAAHKFGKIDFDNLNWEKKYSPMKAYGQSKLANLLFTFELQRRLKAAGKDAIAVASHPGWAKTHEPVGPRLMNMMRGALIQSAEMGALPTIYAAVGDGVEGGRYYGPNGFLELRGFPKEVKPGKRAKDPGTAARLWELSEKLTGVNYEPILAGKSA